MKFPVFSLLAGNFRSRDGFARDYPLQRRVLWELRSSAAALWERCYGAGGGYGSFVAASNIDGVPRCSSRTT